jgi:hypothetical protein
VHSPVIAAGSAFDRVAEFGADIVADLTEETSMPNCIVVVQFDLPKRSEEMAVKGGTSTAPTYRGLARKGLIRKDYLNGENGTGGVYLWDSRESAEAWFTEERVAELDRALWRPASPHLVRHHRDRRQCEGRDPRQRQGD